jgi:hypothetical protein
MTRNQKKRLKMKLKKTQELIEQDKSSMDIANPTMTATTTTTEDNITTNVIITDVGDVSSSQDHMESNGDNNNIQSISYIICHFASQFMLMKMKMILMNLICQ